MVPKDGTRESGHKIKSRKFHLNTGTKFLFNFFSYCEGGQILSQAVQRGSRVFILGDTQNPTGHSPEKFAVAETTVN